MALAKVLKFAALAIGAFILVSVVLSVVSALVGLVWALVTTVATLLTVAALLYGGFKLYSWLSDDGSSERDSIRDRSRTTRTDGTGEDGVARLRERYANGELSEAELERRLELELDGPETDSIDRELSRERS
ncbi:hypothetical protein [Halosimplex salinum]|uniref:hypothetical protein n=1 Tax=Halosimplex salinum TaxID=1710538 RepID=UPI000F4A7158|nr:hypothetical protein [Halosimplex salinum]